MRHPCDQPGADTGGWPGVCTPGTALASALGCLPEDKPLPTFLGPKTGRQRDGYFEVQRKQSRVLALEGRRQQDKEERGQRGGGVHRPPLPLLPIALLWPRLQKLSPVSLAPAQDWQLTPTVPVLLTLLSPQVIPGSQLHHLLFHFMTTLDGLTLAIDSQCPAPLSITFNF